MDLWNTDISETLSELIFIGASKLSEFAKLRFSKRGRTKLRQMMLREELWNEEFYCGDSILSHF